MANCDCEVALVSGPLGLTSPETTLGAGAIVEFLGNVRSLENGKPIEGIEYEAHREMSQHQMRKLAHEAAPRFDLLMIKLHHCVGFDGEIARRYQTVTNFGKLMDPLVDKIMIAAAFISLVPLRAIPAWAATVVVGRDFLITGLRLMAISKGQVLTAERLGKHKTSWQIITVVFFLTLLAIAEWSRNIMASEWWQRAWNQAGAALVWLTVALTLYSGL